MADKKIIQLDPLVSQNTSDLYETSANGTGSFKETRSQQTSYQQANLDFIHTTGSVTPGDIPIYGADGKNAKTSNANFDNSGNLTLPGTLSIPAAPLASSSGGTGNAGTPTLGKILVGNGTSYDIATLGGIDPVMVNYNSGLMQMSISLDDSGLMVLPKGYINGGVISSITNSTLVLGSYAVKDSTSTLSMYSVPNTLDITTSGINGLDTGTVAPDSFYYIYAIGMTGGPNPARGLFSLASFDPLLPSPYDKYRQLASIETDGSSNFIPSSLVYYPPEPMESILNTSKCKIIWVAPEGVDGAARDGTIINPFQSVFQAYEHGVALNVPFTVMCAPGTHTFGDLAFVPYGFIQGYGIGETILHCTGDLTLDDTKWISTGTPIDISGISNATLEFDNGIDFEIDPFAHPFASFYLFNVSVPDSFTTPFLFQGLNRGIYFTDSILGNVNCIGSTVFRKNCTFSQFLLSTRNPDTSADISSTTMESYGDAFYDDCLIKSFAPYSSYAYIYNPAQNYGSISNIRLEGDNTALYIQSSTINVINDSGSPQINYVDKNMVVESSTLIDLSIYIPGSNIRTFGSGSPHITVRVPKDSTYNFGIGVIFSFEQVSNSVIEFTPEDGTITIFSLSNLTNPLSAGSGSIVYLQKVNNNQWIAWGNLQGSTQQYKYWTSDGDLEFNSNNIAGSASLVTLTLPDTSTFPAPYVGEIAINWGNTGGWKVQCNAADIIFVGNKFTSLGGYIASTAGGDGLTLRLVAPSIWVARGVQGTISIDGTATNNAINDVEDGLIVTGDVNPMVPGITYITNSGSLITLTLPSTLDPVNDIFSVVGSGAGGWKVAQSSGQTTYLNAGGVAGTNNTTTGTGGSIASTDRYDAVDLKPISTTDLGFKNIKGNLTLV